MVGLARPLLVHVPHLKSATEREHVRSELKLDAAHFCTASNPLLSRAARSNSKSEQLCSLIFRLGAVKLFHEPPAATHNCTSVSTAPAPAAPRRRAAEAAGCGRRDAG